jgi:hypothetical protein
MVVGAFHPNASSFKHACKPRQSKNREQSVGGTVLISCDYRQKLGLPAQLAETLVKDRLLDLADHRFELLKILHYLFRLAAGEYDFCIHYTWSV